MHLTVTKNINLGATGIFNFYFDTGTYFLNNFLFTFCNIFNTLFVLRAYKVLNVHYSIFLQLAFLSNHIYRNRAGGLNVG